MIAPLHIHLNTICRITHRESIESECSYGNAFFLDDGYYDSYGVLTNRMRGVAFCFQELWQQLKVLRDSLQHLNEEESTLAEEPPRERERECARMCKHACVCEQRIRNCDGWLMVAGC